MEERHWLEEVGGKMLRYRITNDELAAAMGLHPKYLSKILNGHVEPKNVAKRIMTAITVILAQRIQNSPQ